jgi:hypothetical protein
VELTGPNWWAAIQERTSSERTSSGRPTFRLAQKFEVGASMIAADAYDVAPHLIDSENGPGMRLVTTGLIDPGVCRWGKTTCRYLKRDYRHPRIDPAAELTKSLRRRLERAKRPKVLVAGLSRVIECFVDEGGKHIGAVSTYSIFHPCDDLFALRDLSRQLLSPQASERFRRMLSGNAMGGGNTTMTKGFLEEFELEDPDDRCPGGANCSGAGKSAPPC